MKIIYSVMAAAILVLCALLFNLLNTPGTESAVPPQVEPKYHIQLITQNAPNQFWAAFKKGSQRAGEDLGVYVELVDIAGHDTDTMVQTVEKAIYANVDAVALQATDVDKTGEVFMRARKENMKVLTFENDNFLVPNTSTVGSNSFNIGLEAGKMAVEVCGGKGRAVVLINDATNQNKSLKLQGLMEAFSSYPDMEIAQTRTLNAGVFEVDKVVNDILLAGDDINVIICTDEQSTPGVAQVLVDANKVRDIAVIGYGAMEQTLNYIDRGVIYGTVCPDAEEIGYKTVSQLYNALNGSEIGEKLYTDIYTITQGNVKDFLKTDSKKQ
ncbi:sugar ABC transporter substrate-binding protein [Acetanaerobacterium elongatum]|uniref:sugar ABC transporter substrate-binding protein n=1 Tax=Acetanaerobacterium elongatum TaxID=258515 RepID=UPI0013BE9736|nr:sugar ABC transporter substrate-binding protein [Acetanaerobacterium elongatum]